MTKGEYRVGINFNPSSDSTVDLIKRIAADFIDMIDNLIDANSMDPQRDREVARLKALAQTRAEEAAMWAVKAATKGPMV